MWGDAMEQNNGLKLFVSYSHEDNRDDSLYVNEFIKHITMLKDNGLISDIWYDRKILPGEDFQDKINNNLENADIICLFISANFFYSNNCKDEKKRAFELWRKKRVPVIPIILAPCGWKDDKNISENHVLALPTDGKLVSDFPNRDAGWQDVYDGLKKVIEKEIKIKQLKIKEKFENFLQDVEMLTEAHPKKERVLLDDIFVYPDLDKYDSLKKNIETISSEELFKAILDYSRIVIVGEEQSGKTTICKMIFKKLRSINLIPVYISDTKTHFSGKIENKILESLNEQYEGVEINEVYENYKDRIVPIIDDFHLAKSKEKHIKDLSTYSMNVIVVDNISSLNISEVKLISSFDYFKIKELKPSLRDDLLRKWIGLSDGGIRNDYKNIDERTVIINSTLGKTLGKGIMPAYPFFVLSAVVTYETAAIPLDQEITSQGYCYQAFIYFYLRKRGVESDVETYLNFLTEFAFYIYESKKYELSPDEFNSFMQLYSGKFNFTIETDTLLSNLSLIISRDSLNNYSFRYQYVYYFFVAKYLAENLRRNNIEKEIEKIILNLHIDENAYIAVFIAHHSKDIEILDKIESNASCLFDKYKSATLIKEEVGFFDEQADIIVEAALPPGNTTPEKERKEILIGEDRKEQSQEDIKKMEDSDKEDLLGKELRRAVKTVEVMGHIMKNRAGSLEKTKLEEMFRLAMNVYLRILSSFFDIIKDKNDQKSVIDFISEGLIKINEEEREQKKKQVSEEKLRKLARIIFWNLIFFTASGFIDLIVRSLGSDKLTEISNKVCGEVNTPGSFLVKHGILIWYAKNLQIDEIAKKIKEPEFSKLAGKIIKFEIVKYCRLHLIDYKDKQRIERELGIPTKQFLLVDRESHE